MKPKLQTTNDRPHTEYARAVFAFRATAFHTAYDFTFAGIPDLTERFVRSIIHSARPIPEYKRSQLLAWYRARRKGQKHSVAG